MYAVKLIHSFTHSPLLTGTGFPVSLLLISMIYTGSKTLQYLTVAMFTVFKNLTIVVVALGEEFFFASRITGMMWMAFGLMILGSIIGGFNDLSFSLAGYVWMALNSATSAAYLLYMKRTIKAVSFADFDSTYYNNLLALPVLLAFSLVFEDWHSFVLRVMRGDGPTNVRLALGMSCSGLAGFMISFTTAWCVRVAPSTTFSMVGALNKLPVALSGLLFFSAERTAVNFGYVLSIVVSFSAGLVYSYSQLRKAGAGAKTIVAPNEDDKNSLLSVLSTSPLKRIFEEQRILAMEHFSKTTGASSYTPLPMPSTPSVPSTPSMAPMAPMAPMAQHEMVNLHRGRKHPVLDADTVQK